MRAYTLDHIRRLSPRAYEVALAEGEARVTFQLSVAGGEIELLVWEDDFSAFMHEASGPPGPLLEAVLAFHQAASRPLVVTSGREEALPATTPHTPTTHPAG